MLNATADILKAASDYCVKMQTFFDLAEREITEHNNTDFDGIELLVESAKTETFRLSTLVCEIQGKSEIGKQHNSTGGKDALDYAARSNMLFHEINKIADELEFFNGCEDPGGVASKALTISALAQLGVKTSGRTMDKIESKS